MFWYYIIVILIAERVDCQISPKMNTCGTPKNTVFKLLGDQIWRLNSGLSLKQ